MSEQVLDHDFGFKVRADTTTYKKSFSFDAEKRIESQASVE